MILKHKQKGVLKVTHSHILFNIHLQFYYMYKTYTRPPQQGAQNRVPHTIQCSSTILHI